MLCSALVDLALMIVSATIAVLVGAYMPQPTSIIASRSSDTIL